MDVRGVAFIPRHVDGLRDQLHCVTLIAFTREQIRSFAVYRLASRTALGRIASGRAIYVPPLRLTQNVTGPSQLRFRQISVTNLRCLDVLVLGVRRSRHDQMAGRLYVGDWRVAVSNSLDRLVFKWHVTLHAAVPPEPAPLLSIKVASIRAARTSPVPFAMLLPWCKMTAALILDGIGLRPGWQETGDLGKIRSIFIA